jgi:protein SCO1/2
MAEIPPFDARQTPDDPDPGAVAGQSVASTPASTPASPPSSPAPGGPRGIAIVVGLFVAFVVVLGVGLVVRASIGGGVDPSDESRFNGTLLDVPRERPSFELVDTDGQPFNFAERTDGQLTILFFGYANCPDVCPITLATLDGALSAVRGVNPQVVFVSIDPERDSPADLRAYLDRFDSRFVGLTGTPEQLAVAQQAAGVTPAFNEGANSRGGYDVGHSSQVIVYTPDGQAHLVYGFGVRQDEWVADLQRLRSVDEWW